MTVVPIRTGNSTGTARTRPTSPEPAVETPAHIPSHSADPVAARRVGQLPGWQRWSAYLAMGACALSGLIWFLLRDVIEVPPNSRDRFVLVTHGISSFVVLMAFGSVLPTHVRAAWRARRNRWLGALSIALMATLAVTALGLYYGSEEWHDPTRWTHIIIGLAAVLGIPLHIVIGRRPRRSRPAAASLG